LIRVEGVDVPRGAIAGLALRLHKAGHVGLANHLGRAIDRHLDQIDVWPRDFERILAVNAGQPIPGLQPLLDVMRLRAAGRPAGDAGDDEGRPTGAGRS
jgi:hypothetical protein